MTGALSLRSPAGQSLRVDAAGATLRVHVASLGDLWRLGRSETFSGRRPRFSGAATSLRATGLSLALHVRGREIGRLGRHARPSRLAALLGLTPLEINVRGLAGCLFRREPGSTA